MTKPKEIKLPDCECGCGEKTKGGRFLPGHDAKLKKALVADALSGSKRAATKLEALGWTKFLEQKREKLAPAAPKKAGKARASKRPAGPSQASKASEPAPSKPHRGRPPKRSDAMDGSPEVAAPSPARKRGRPRKEQEQTPSDEGTDLPATGEPALE